MTMMKVNISLLAALGAGLACGIVGCRSVGCTTRFVYATWNIGHYSWGGSWKSTVSPEDGERRAADYRAFLDRIGADVVGVCEYAEDFTTNGSMKASAALFGGYPGRSIGPSRSYQWNAQFWKGFGALERKTVDYVERHQKVYYQATRLEIGGEDVWIVQTHLDWTTFMKGFERYRERQMQKLIDDFRDKPRVIISGDFNVGDRGANGVRREKMIPAPEEYDVFVRAGYALANSNGTPTCPSGKPTQPLDNIIVKGLDISDVRFHPAGDLSDHDAVSCTLTLRR